MTTVADDIRVTPLSNALGAEISGVDLRRELAPDTVRRIRDAWNEHIVLVIRDQDLSMEQQLRFAGCFGALGERRRKKTALKKAEEGLLQTNPHTLLVSNIKVDGKPIGAFGEGEMWFHIDSGYAERPYKYTFLYGLEIPSRGGNTRFANMYKAYETLPEEIKERVRGRTALHVHEYKRAERVPPPEDLAAAPHWHHPVVVTHPETGRKSLFVDRLMTSCIDGMDREESESLLTYLFDHAENPAFIFEHVWRRKDFIMWDNRCVTHARTDFPRDENRLLRRCTVEGEPLHA
jgi:taurine dioxygenase